MPAKVESAKEGAARVVVRAAGGVDIMDADGAVIATVAVVAAATKESHQNRVTRGDARVSSCF